MSAELAQALQERREASRARIPVETLAIMDSATAELEASGLAQQSLPVGSPAPDFSLPNATGEEVKLSKLLAQGPVILAFYRGGWCPYCSIELRALQARMSEILAAGATLVVISPQTPDNSLSTAEKLELAFPVLSDVGNQVARAYGLVFSLPEDLRDVYNGWGLDLPAANGDETFELPVPATYVIATDGTVAWKFADADYTKRAEPDHVIASLAAL